jgi:DNA polymerase-3 subunit beta
MKIKITPDQYQRFSKAITMAGAVAKTNKSTMPILGDLLITAETGSISIRATSLDEWIDVNAEAEVAWPGQVCLPARDLLRIISFARSMEIESGDKFVTVKCGGTFKFPVADVKDFPAWPECGEQEAFHFSSADLSKVLHPVYAASDPSMNRYTLQGIQLNPEEKQSVATDGRCMALSKFPIEKDGWGPIIPDSACQLMRGYLGEADEFAVKVSPSFVSLSCASLTFHAKLIEGTYPAFQNVLTKPDFSVLVDRGAFLTAIDAAGVAISVTGKLELEMTASEIHMRALGSNAEVSAACDYKKLPPEKAIGFKICVDLRLLKKAVAGMKDEDVSLGFTDNLTPMFVQADSCAIISPMRLS